MSFSRTPSAAFAALLFFCLGPAIRADQAYLAEFEDLPLAPGLAEQPGGTLFESPAGRIVETTARGDAAPETVKAFYRQTLPQLGWEPADGGYRRDGELLRIDIDGSQQPLTVRFSVVPR